MKIYDLHCDLLSYWERDPKRTPSDPESNCSIPQMEKGGIAFQTLAIYSRTRKGSVARAKRQFDLYQTLKGPFVISIENASGLLEEDEPLHLAFPRLKQMLPVLYLSLTWNHENRFGGGNLSQVGLKHDGEALLDHLAESNVLIDFSHTSDWLAHDILNYIDKKKLPLKPIASHSNFRQITDVPRNLPDEIAREIIKRGGVIGINFVRSFVGSTPKDFIRHIQHALTLGGENALCLGADFFTEKDIPPDLEHLRPMFFENLGNSSCYPTFFSLLKDHFSDALLQKLAHKNAERFLNGI